MPIQFCQRAFVVFVGLIIAAFLPASAAEPNLSGTWTATIHIPKVSSGDATLRLEQNGEKLSGHITNAYGRESELNGTIVGTQIQLSYTSSAIRLRTDSGDKPLTLNFLGSASHDEIEAKATTPLGDSTLKAKKK